MLVYVSNNTLVNLASLLERRLQGSRSATDFVFLVILTDSRIFLKLLQTSSAVAFAIHTTTIRMYSTTIRSTLKEKESSSKGKK